MTKPMLDLESFNRQPLEERQATLLYWTNALNDSYDRLAQRNRMLTDALGFATKYVAKAVADGLMEDCAVPASVALTRLRAVLSEQESRVGL